MLPPDFVRCELEGDVFGPALIQSSCAFPDQTHRHTIRRSVLPHPVSYAGRVHRGHCGPGAYLVCSPESDVLLIGAVRRKVDPPGITGLLWLTGWPQASPWVFERILLKSNCGELS